MTKTSEIVRAAASIGGWMSEPELAWLAEAARKANVIIELGCWKGRSTKALAMATTGVVYAVDRWNGTEDRDDGPGRPPDTTYKEADDAGWDSIYLQFLESLAPEIRAGKVVVARLDHGRFDLARVLPPADLVFVDGDHRGHAVARDVRTAVSLARNPGAVVSGHDYRNNIPDLDRVVESLPADVSVAAGVTIWSFPRSSWRGDPT